MGPTFSHSLTPVSRASQPLPPLRDETSVVALPNPLCTVSSHLLPSPPTSHLPQQGRDVTTYTYNRGNAYGGNETRTTSVNHFSGAIKSLITFSDGKGFVTSIELRGCEADNIADYYRGGPHDGFMCGDYSYLNRFNHCTGPGIMYHGIPQQIIFANNNTVPPPPTTTTTLQGPTYSAAAPGVPSAVTTAQAPAPGPLVPVPAPTTLYQGTGQPPLPLTVAEVPVIPNISAAPMPVAGPRQYGPITGYGVPQTSQYYSTYPAGYVPMQPSGMYGGYRGYW